MAHWQRFLQALTEFVHTHQLFTPSDGILAAVSGGLDSVVMLEGLASLHQSGLLFDISVVYVDHGLRPTETPQEAQWVQAIAAQHGFSSHVCYLDLSQGSPGDSTQTRARHLRRKALETLAQETHRSKIATGHHADDQAETVMQRWLRGTGPRGLAGIWPQQGSWIHPLLPFSRAELHQVAQEKNWTWLEDPSNQTLDYNRNRIRNELIPYLEKQYNPQLRTHLHRMAGLMQRDEQFFAQCVQQHCAPPWMDVYPQHLVIHLEPWGTLPPALQWRLLRHAIQLTLQGQDVPLLHLERLLQFAQEQAGSKTLEIPAPLHIVREYHQLFFYPATPLVSAPAGSADHPTHPDVIKIEQPGTYSGAWGVIEVEMWSPSQSGTPSASTQTASQEEWSCFIPTTQDIDPQKCPWLIRTRQAGDTLDFGTHHRPLKKWMIDAKIPRSWRHNIPLLEHQGSILCVMGWLCLPPCTQTPPTQGWRFRWIPHTSQPSPIRTTSTESSA